MRIGYLGSPDGWYYRDLVRAAPDNVQLNAYSYADLDAWISVRGTELRCGVEPLSACASILVRSMPHATLEQVVFRMNALAILEEQGVTVRNRPRSLEVAVDKFLSLAWLQAAGCHVPRTACCQSAEAALRAFDALGGDVVVKPVFGGEGRGILRVDQRPLAERVFRTLEQMQTVLYVQEYIDHPGHDLRLFVVGTEVWGMQRVCRGDWRTNISQGAIGQVHSVTPEEAAMAFKVSSRLGADICGVDILRDRLGKPYILEANAVPGWKKMAEVHQADLSGVVLRYLQSVAESRSPL